MGDSWYFDWINPASALKQSMIKGAVPFELHYVKDIMSTKLAQFQYGNIERIPNLTSRTLEMALLFSNFLCFYKDPALGWGLYRYVVDGDLDSYLNPQFVTLNTLKGVTVATRVPFKDIILARDNELDIPPFLCIFEYLVKMQHIDSVIFKTLDVSALPLVVAGSKKIVNQYNSIVKELTGGKAFVAGDDQLIDAVKAFKIDLPVQPIDTYELKKQYRNECLTSIGIYSVEDKKERVLKGEQMSRNRYVDNVYADMKIQREYFVDRLNKADPSLHIELIETTHVIDDEQAEQARKIAEAEGGVGDVNKESK